MNSLLQVSLDYFLLTRRMALTRAIIGWQSSQVVGYPGTAQTWDSKVNQHFERRTLYDRSTARS